MSRDRLPGAVLALAGVAVGLEALTFDVNFMTDPVGPKALPLLVALLFLGAGLDAWVRPGVRPEWPSPDTGVKLGAAALLLLLYPFALGFVGFFLATTLAVGGLSRLYGARSWHGLGAAAVLSGVLWLLFVRLLALPLPIGDLWTR